MEKLIAATEALINRTEINSVNDKLVVEFAQAVLEYLHEKEAE